MPTAPANLAGVRQMLRALKRRESVGLLPDQVPPEGQGVWAPFFGQPAYTMTLAIAAGAADRRRLPGAALRAPAARRRLRDPRVASWCAPLPAGTDAAAQVEAATIINETMEQVILSDPGQYLWGYNRYKAPRAAETTPTPPRPRRAEGTE